MLFGMRAGIEVSVTPGDRRRLETIVGNRNSLQKHVARAQALIATAEGLGTNEVMRRSGLSKPAVWRWQERFMREGVEGLLRDKTRKPGKAPLPAGTVAQVVELTLADPPGETTHWTGRAMARLCGIGVVSVQRIWKAHGLTPHRMRTFKLSKDPRFGEKFTDVVGLYVDPPAHAVVLSMDEKSQIQALDRTQPGLPLKKGRAGTMTHDYKRRDHHALRRAQRARRIGDRPLHAAPPPSGVHPFPEPGRSRSPGRQGRPRHSR